MEKKIICSNKSAYHDYTILDTIKAGIVLYGSEVKSCRNNAVVLKGSYGMIIKGELFLLGCHISEYSYTTGYFKHNPDRQKKLLVHKKEILKLYQQIKEKGVSLIPLSIYFEGNLIKVDLGICKGKHNYDKRESLKEKQIDRDLKRFI